MNVVMAEIITFVCKQKGNECLLKEAILPPKI